MSLVLVLLKFNCDVAVNRNGSDARAAVIAKDHNGGGVDGAFRSQKNILGSSRGVILSFLFIILS